MTVDWTIPGDLLHFEKLYFISDNVVSTFWKVRDLKSNVICRCVFLVVRIHGIGQLLLLNRNPCFLLISGSEVMQVERKWHILLTIFFLLITSGQCMDNKEVKQKERRTLLDLILQVIRESQQLEKPVSRCCNSGLYSSTRDMKFSSHEKPFYVPRLDNSKLIGKLIRFIFRSWWWKHNPHFTMGDSCHWSGLCRTSYLWSFIKFGWMELFGCMLMEKLWKRKLGFPV